jgi:hypothetical protein
MPTNNNPTTDHPARERATLTLILAWLAAGVPLLWGVVQTIEKTLALFR